MINIHKGGKRLRFKNASTIRHGINSESEVIDMVIDDLSDNGIFYDVGACHGLYTILVKAVLPDVEVHAFEPHPQNRKRMIENLEDNNMDNPIEQVALTNSVGERQFTTGEGPGVHRLSFDDSIPSMSVETTTLDEYVYGGLEDIPEVIKIDVEGAEYEVLKGAEKLLSGGGVKSVYIEIHGDTDKGSSLENYEGSERLILSLLESNGYSVTRVNQRKNTYHMKATLDD